jgi:hypothetical protein
MKRTLFSSIVILILSILLIHQVSAFSHNSFGSCLYSLQNPQGMIIRIFQNNSNLNHSCLEAKNDCERNQWGNLSCQLGVLTSVQRSIYQTLSQNPQNLYWPFQDQRLNHLNQQQNAYSYQRYMGNTAPVTNLHYGRFQRSQRDHSLKAFCTIHLISNRGHFLAFPEMIIKQTNSNRNLSEAQTLACYEGLLSCIDKNSQSSSFQSAICVASNGSFLF